MRAVFGIIIRRRIDGINVQLSILFRICANSLFSDRIDISISVQYSGGIKRHRKYMPVINFEGYSVDGISRRI